MKKALSLLLVLTMILSMIPIGLTAVSAEDEPAAAPTTSWTDAGNYDISWCKTLTRTADNEEQIKNETFELNGTYYHIKAWTKETYHITTPAQLAGLAYLSNLASGDLFKGDTFLIEADLDLSAHLWVPIAQKSKFRGSLVGSVNGGAATIKGMIVNTSASTETVPVGLIGKFGGDWIKNLRLEDAKVTARSFTVGGFVGWQDGNVGSGTDGQGGYENLWTNAEIVLTSGNADRFDAVGGMIGCINNCNTNNQPTIIRNCVFTGTISAPMGDNVGGILGMSQYDFQAAPVISDCVVITEKMEYGFNNIGFTQNWNAGFGGIAGLLYANQKKDENGTVITTDYSTVTNCYFAGVMFVLDCEEATLEVQNIGGIVGASCSQVKTYENCQFDGMIFGSGKRVGSMLGRALEPAAIRNSVATGIVLNSNGVSSNFLGREKEETFVTENCYSAIEMLDAVSGTPVTQIGKETDLSALLALKDADDKAIWTKEEGALYPILSIAKSYLNDANKHLSVAMSGKDFSAITFTTGITVADQTALDAFLTVLETVRADENRELLAQSVNVTMDVTTGILEQYTAEQQKYIKIAMGLEPDAQDDQLSVAFLQIATEANSNPEKPQIDGTYNIRIVAKMTNTNLEGVKFSYIVVSGDDKTEKVTAAVTDCYRELVKVTDAGTETLKAEDGSYYVVYVIKNVKLDTEKGTTISVKASAAVAGSEETVKSSTATFTVAEAAPSDNT